MTQIFRPSSNTVARLLVVGAIFGFFGLAWAHPLGAGDRRRPDAGRHGLFHARARQLPVDLVVCHRGNLLAGNPLRARIVRLLEPRLGEVGGPRPAKNLIVLTNNKHPIGPFSNRSFGKGRV